MSKTLTEKLAEVRVGTHWETSMGVLWKLAGKPPSGALENRLGSFLCNKLLKGG